MLEPYRDAKGKIRLSQEKQYEARQYVIDNLIMRELLYQEGCRKGIKVSEWLLEKGVDTVYSPKGFKGKGPGYVFSDAGVDVIVSKGSLSNIKSGLQKIRDPF